MRLPLPTERHATHFRPVLCGFSAFRTSSAPPFIKRTVSSPRCSFGGYLRRPVTPRLLQYLFIGGLAVSPRGSVRCRAIRPPSRPTHTAKEITFRELNMRRPSDRRPLQGCAEGLLCGMYLSPRPNTSSINLGFKAGHRCQGAGNRLLVRWSHAAAAASIIRYRRTTIASFHGQCQVHPFVHPFVPVAAAACVSIGSAAPIETGAAAFDRLVKRPGEFLRCRGFPDRLNGGERAFQPRRTAVSRAEDDGVAGGSEAFGQRQDRLALNVDVQQCDVDGCRLAPAPKLPPGSRQGRRRHSPVAERAFQR